jgi:hypothetical protein
MPFLRGLLIRVGLGAMPLLIVIFLCCLMMGFPGRVLSHKTLVPPPAQAAVVPPSERLTLPKGAQNDTPPPIAKFENQHIQHAHIHVPY